MTDPLAALMLGGLVGYALKPDGRLEPIDYSKLAAMLDGSDKAFAKNVAIDTSTARAKPTKYTIPGMTIFVDNPSTPTQPVYIRFNDPNGEEFTLTNFKMIEGPFGSFYIRNEAGAGILNLIVTKGFQFRFSEAVGTMSTVVDHGACTGLTDDDHTQYLLADGTRQLTGDMSVAGGKKVDGIDISAHDVATTGVHGAGSDTLATDADIDTDIATHAALDTGVHGAGVNTLATDADIDADVATHAALTATHGVTGAILGTEDVDDTPVNGATTVPASSNWAYDHDADADAHHAQTHGAAQHTDVTRELFLPASAGVLRGGTATYRGEYATIRGDADADEPFASFAMKVPDDFVSFTSVKAIWSSPAAAGNMRWQSAATYASCGQSYDTHTDGGPMGVTATGGANLLNCQEHSTPLTLVDLASGDFLGLGFYRDGSDALDTLDAYVFLYGFLFTYVGHQ